MKLKQFAAVGLAAIMTVGTALPAFAAVRVSDPPMKKDLKPSLTIHKFVENNGRNEQGTGLVDNDAINTTPISNADALRDNVPLDGIKYSYKMVGTWYSEAGNFNGDQTIGGDDITAEETVGDSATGAYWTSIDSGIFGTQDGSILKKLNLDQKYTEFKEKVPTGSDADMADNERDGWQTIRRYSNANIEEMLNDILATPAVDVAVAPRTDARAGEVLLNEYLAANGTLTGATNANGAVTVDNLPQGLYMLCETDITAHDGVQANGDPYVVRPWDSLTTAEKAAWATGTTDPYGGTLASKMLTADQQTEYAGLADDAARKAFYEALYEKELTQDSSDYKNPEWPVVETRSHPFLVSLPMTNVAEIPANQASDSKLHKPGTVWQYDVDVYPKNQTTNISKRILDPDDVDNESVGASKAALQVTEDFMMNEIVKQVIYADVPVLQPSFTYDVNDTGITEMVSVAPTHKTFKIKDTMDEGLYFKGATTVSVVVGPKTKEDPTTNEYFTGGTFKTLTRNTHYTVSGNAGASSFEVTLTPAGLKMLDTYDAVTNPDGIKVDSQLAVYFDCDLDMAAKIGTDDAYSKKGNGNRPTLTWQNSNTEERSVDGNYCYVYTYELDILKTGISQPEAVKFEVTHQLGFTNTDPRKGTLVKWAYDVDPETGDEIPGQYHVYDSNGKDADLDQAKVFTQVSPAHDGSLKLKGFDSKTYRFREAESQSGTSLLRDTFDISFQEDAAVHDGELTDAVLEVDGAKDSLDINKTANGGIVSVDVANQKEISLRTGGEGRTGVLVIGGVVIAGLGAFLFARKRKQTVA